MALLGMLRWSLKLDYIFLFRVSGLPALEKIKFIFLKYLSFLKIRIFGGKDRKYSTRVFGRNFFYSDSYGLASLQRVYCSSYTLKSLLPSCPVVIDVGANIGQFNFFCSHYLRAKRIISIEPIKECFELLVLNSNNANDCLNEIVGIQGDEVVFYLAKDSSQLSSYIKDDNLEYTASYAARVSRLDELLNGFDLNILDLIKVDTEGSEFDVLMSSVNILEKTKHILVEMSIFRKSSGNLFKVGSYLESKGFSLVEMSTEYEMKPKDIDGFFKKV